MYGSLGACPPKLIEEAVVGSPRPLSRLGIAFTEGVVEQCNGLGQTRTEVKVGALIALGGIVVMFGMLKGLLHWDTVMQQRSAKRRAKMLQNPRRRR